MELGGRIHRQGFFDDLAWIHAGATHRAAKHLLIVDNAMAVIQKQYGEDLMFKIAKHCLHVFFGACGAGDFETGLETSQNALPGALNEGVAIDGSVGTAGISDSKCLALYGHGLLRLGCFVDVHRQDTALSAGIKYLWQTGAGRSEATTRVQPKPGGPGTLGQ